MADDFGKIVRDAWRDAEEADKDNREEQLKDMEFASGKHWDDQVRAYRERMGMQKYGFPLPCLTVNNIPALIAQVTGDRRANEVAIKALPTEDSDREGASVRSEIIRNIEVRSKAQRTTYLPSFGAMVNGGQSNFRVDLDYAYDDVFDQDIFIRPIPNPLAVLWDPMSADPTGKDAKYCFVTEKIKREEFKRRFKDAQESDLDATGLRLDGWVDSEHVRITEYWEMVEKPRTIAMLQNPYGGEPVIEDVTDVPEQKWKPRLITHPTTGKPMVRQAPRKYARMVITNGNDALTDPYELALSRLPIIRVSGPEMWVGDKRVRHGLVRFARDPARLKDYWRSVIAEKLMLAPRANYMGPASSFEGRESDWPNTLIYNDGTQPPTPITTNDLAAMMNEAQMCAEDIRDVTGIFEASRGMQGNETSGKAIYARQQEGDIATIVFHDMMNASQEEAGEVIRDMLPMSYDTARTLRLIGPNEAGKFLRVNDPLDPNSIDLSKGRYDITISTGPSYMTRRQEASASMIEATQAAPQLWQIAGDLIAKAQDWPDADIIAERIKRSIPPQLLGEDEKADAPPDPAQQGQQQQMQAMAQQQAMLQQAAMAQDMRLKSAQADKAQADAAKSHAEALKAYAELNAGDGGDLEATRVRTEQYNAVTNRLKALLPHAMPKEPQLTPEQKSRPGAEL